MLQNVVRMFLPCCGIQKAVTESRSTLCSSRPTGERGQTKMDVKACDPLKAMKDVLEKIPAGKEYDEQIASVENHLRNEIRKQDFRSILKVSVFILVTFSVFTSCTPIYGHLRALGRIGLIKLTPYWDWIDYYDRDCLVENTPSTDTASSLRQLDCSVCEDIGNIQVIKNVSSRYLVDQYLNQNVPVVVSDGTLDWPTFNDPNFNLKNIAHAYHSDKTGWRTCQWKSNILPSDIELDEFFNRVKEFSPDRPWFAHWENCGRKSIKTGRRFYSRPYFLTPAVDLSFKNWILISNKYSAQRFKKVNLHSRLVMVAQIRGLNHIKLLPESSCQSECSTIKFVLFEGEIALFNAKQWKLEYQPGEDSFNIAFIIQGEMD